MVVSKKECSHHWIIESPKGSTSKGVCKKCGAEKEFQNYISKKKEVKGA